jgi:hypothetical protein
VNLQRYVVGARQYHERDVAGSSVRASTAVRREPNTPTLGTAKTDEIIVDPVINEIVIQDTNKDKKRKRSTSEQQKSWDKRFAQLKAFHELHGHCQVPIKYDREEAPGLCQRTKNQRYLVKKERKQRLR